MVRLDKYLADMGKGSRSEIKKYVKAKRVKINGEIAKSSDIKIAPDSDEIRLDECLISYEEHVYYMLNKPEGVVSATEDNLHKTVIDLIKSEDKRRGLFSMGRLDIDTTGLLIITDDGELSHRLLSPKYHVDKCYYAIVEGKVSEEDAIRVKEPLNIGSDKEPIMTLPASMDIISSSDEISEINLTICEGKFHQVKKMMAKLNHPVIKLKRVSFGAIKLDEELKPGEYRKLTNEELEMIKV
ncbi:MAG: rRNA pseudouridine synthase [Lachnospiraceae bacterium]|nr:rRNA pseudouridine synthase [Lachnospiraceae bacterium]